MFLHYENHATMYKRNRIKYNIIEILTACFGTILENTNRKLAHRLVNTVEILWAELNSVWGVWREW